MAAISLKLPHDLLEASSRCATALKLSRAAYIRRAVERMNRETQAQLRARRIADVSRRVRGESMRVNAEFAAHRICSSTSFGQSTTAASSAAR